MAPVQLAGQRSVSTVRLYLIPPPPADLLHLCDGCVGKRETRLASVVSRLFSQVWESQPSGTRSWPPRRGLGRELLPAATLKHQSQVLAGERRANVSGLPGTTAAAEDEDPGLLQHALLVPRPPPDSLALGVRALASLGEGAWRWGGVTDGEEA